MFPYGQEKNESLIFRGKSRRLLRLVLSTEQKGIQCEIQRESSGDCPSRTLILLPRQLISTITSCFQPNSEQSLKPIQISDFHSSRTFSSHLLGSIQLQHVSPLSQRLVQSMLAHAISTKHNFQRVPGNIDSKRVRQVWQNIKVHESQQRDIRTRSWWPCCFIDANQTTCRNLLRKTVSSQHHQSVAKDTAVFIN